MQPFKTYRDPELSLWQSAVEESFAAQPPAAHLALDIAARAADLVHRSPTRATTDPLLGMLPAGPAPSAEALP